MEENRKNSSENSLVVPRELLIECTDQALKQFRQDIADAKRRLGARYNRYNDCEACMRRFPMDDALKVWEEYELIFNKKTSQPSVVRNIIRQIGDIARRQALIKYMKKEGIVYKDGQFVKAN